MAKKSKERARDGAAPLLLQGRPVTAASANPSAEFWEPRYSGADPEWGSRPNARFTEILPRLALRPGLALDLGCGHDGDALWLASLGWHVTVALWDATAGRPGGTRTTTAGWGLEDHIAALAWNGPGMLLAATKGGAVRALDPAGR